MGCSMLEKRINIKADCLKTFMNISIGKTNDSTTERFQILCPLRVFLQTFRLIMLRAVNFYHKRYLLTKEIDNIRRDDVLPIEEMWTIPQIIVPKMAFLRSHMFPKFFCFFRQKQIYRRTMKFHVDLLIKMRRSRHMLALFGKRVPP